MRASIRRIDLTEHPAKVEAWPSMDWLSGEIADPGPRTPRGRGGLWTAMASAVARAREASGPTPVTDLREPAGAQVIDLAVEAPHLAYLARVAAGTPGQVGDDGSYEADVIVFDSPRYDTER